MFDGTQIIADEFKSTVFKAITRYGKKYATDEKNIRIEFSLNPKGENVYKVFVASNGQTEFKEEVTFKDLLNVKIDILQKGQKVPPIIQVSLMVMGDENGMEEHTARIIMSRVEYLDDKKKKQTVLRMSLCDKDKWIKDVTFQNIIDILTKLAEQHEQS